MGRKPVLPSHKPPAICGEGTYTRARGDSQEVAMSSVFVVDADRRPHDPVHPGRARHLRTTGHAAVLRHAPFTLILQERRPEATPEPFRVTVDPGSRPPGLAVVSEATGQGVWAGEMIHQGPQVK